MSRRVSLPAADDLFRSHRHTAEGRRQTESRERGAAVREIAAVREMAAVPDQRAAEVPEAAEVVEAPAEPAKRKSSGRVRHDEKMTVYVTADELLDIEHARLSLRRHQGLAVDRGRLVREAIAIVLADFENNGDDSVLVQRLIGR